MISFKSFINEVKKPTGGLKKACWSGYTAVGTKEKNGGTVPNCVPEEVVTEAKGIPVAHGYTMRQKHSGKYRVHSPSGEHVGDVEKEGNMWRYHGSSNPNWPGNESHKDYQTDKVENKHEAGDIVAHLHHSGMKNEEVEEIAEDGGAGAVGSAGPTAVTGGVAGMGAQGPNSNQSEPGVYNNKRKKKSPILLGMVKRKPPKA